LSPCFLTRWCSPPVSVFPFPAGPSGTPPTLTPTAVSCAAPVPPLAPPAILVPFVVLDVDLVPSVADRATLVPPAPLAAPQAAPTPSVAPPAPLAALHAALAPTTAPHATPLPPARYTEPVQVYRRRPVPPLLLPSPALPLEVPLDYVPPVRYVYRRSSTAPPPPPSPEPSPAPPPAPTPPPPPPPPPLPRRSRVESAVYHPPVIHRDPRHTHPMVTRQAARVLRLRALSATEGEPRLSPIPTSVREALVDPKRRAIVQSFPCQPDLGPCAASVWLQCGDRQVDLDNQAPC
jgi:hypothetical protein